MPQIAMQETEGEQRAESRHQAIDMSLPVSVFPQTYIEITGCFHGDDYR